MNIMKLLRALENPSEGTKVPSRRCLAIPVLGFTDALTSLPQNKNIVARNLCLPHFHHMIYSKLESHNASVT